MPKQGERTLCSYGGSNRSSKCSKFTISVVRNRSIRQVRAAVTINQRSPWHFEYLASSHLWPAASVSATNINACPSTQRALLSYAMRDRTRKRGSLALGGSSAETDFPLGIVIVTNLLREILAISRLQITPKSESLSRFAAANCYRLTLPSIIGNLN